MLGGLGYHSKISKIKGLLCEYFQVTALFEMLCIQSECFPETLEPCKRMPEATTFCSPAGGAAEVSHLLDNHLSNLVNSYRLPNHGMSSHKLMYTRLMHYIQFCKF